MVPAICFLTLVFMTGTSAHGVARPCDQQMFHSNVDMCLSVFNHSVETSGYQDGCPWPMVNRSYVELSECVGYWAVESSCKGRGSLVDQVYLEVHHTYFSLCGQVRDPPLMILVALVSPSVVLTILMPLLCVYLNPQDYNTTT